jgi:hypothetical protein
VLNVHHLIWPTALSRVIYPDLSTLFPVSNNRNNSREDAKAQRNDYHVSVFLRAFASSREKLFLSVRALMAGFAMSL